MDKEILSKIIYIIVAILIASIAVKIFIWLLPIILVLILAAFIYNSIKKDKKEHSKGTKSNKKKIIIIDEKDIK